MISFLFFDILPPEEPHYIPDELSIREALVIDCFAIEHFVNIPLDLFYEIRVTIPFQETVSPLWRMYFLQTHWNCNATFGI